MKSKLIILSTVLAASLISGNLFSQEFHQWNRERDEFRNRDPIKEKLHLSAEQIDKIEALKLSHRKDMISLRADIEMKVVELEELKNDTNFSREAYLKKVNEIILVKNKLELARANHQMDVYQLLDENQKQEWNKMTRILHNKKHRMVREIRDKVIY